MTDSLCHQPVPFSLAEVHMPCTLCHTCKKTIQHVLNQMEFCPHCQQYQCPLSHGFQNPAPTEAEQTPCEALTVDSLTNPTDPWDNADIISRYSRATAIEDGMLVEVPPALCKEFGIRFSLALTRAVWDDYVTVPEPLKGFQDEQGRLADILTMFHLAAKRSAPPSTQIMFQVIIQQEHHDSLPPPITLKAIVDGGDDGLGALTILKPHED